ncbi:MAG: NAD-dependent epimerase/dehydratase family protein [Candidatus Competibacterales bacterium]|nr:NAD-dependent epimerase/dehydratase family protein [Candidatus Competibacterales bacterium]
MARIVIAGCGDLGTGLGLALGAQGHTVWGLRRNPVSLPAPLRPLAADLTDPDSLGSLPEAVDYVVYAVAAGGYREELYRAAYVDGVANLLAALRDRGERLRRLLLVSSSSVYGQQQGEWVDETSPATATGFAAESLRAGERLVWDAPHPATVVRFTGIYGPGRTRLIDQVRQGVATCEPGLYGNRIHRDDCVAALQWLLLRDDAAELYLGVDDAPVEQCEVLDWLAAELGTVPPRRSSGTARTRPRSNKRCRNRRLKETGWRPTYPSYQEGYAALVAEQERGR